MARAPIDPRLWRYARSARRYLTLSVMLSVVITGSIVVTAVMLGRVLAGVVTDPGRRSLGAWTAELVVLALAVTCRVLTTWVQSRLAHRAGAGVVAELETAVLAAGARLPPRELESRRTELAVVVGTGLSGLRGYLAGYLPALLLAVLVPPIVLMVIAVHDPMSGLIVLVTLPLIPVFMILVGLLTQGRAEATLAATTRLSDQLLDLFAGMPTLRALGRERDAAACAPAERISGARSDIVSSSSVVPNSGRSAVSNSQTAVVDSPGSCSNAIRSPSTHTSTMQYRVRDLGDALRQRTMRTLRIAFLSSMVLEMLATLSVALVAVSIGLRLVFGEMSLYAGLVALVLAPEVYLPLRTVGERFHAAQDGMASANRAFAILGATPGPTVSAPPGVNVSAPAAAVRDVIELRDLTVSARDGAAPAGLSAVLRPGALTVLNGPNGSGKSTVVLAILGLIAPDRGSVTVDGTDVRDLEPDQWWSRVAWLPQRPVLVPGTLRENLELLGAEARNPTGGGPARIVDDLEAACVATGFDTVLTELPDRWDTVVGQGGIGLSLGQRQRLALTRVLAADRPILLLDEPTAHLDPESETVVLAALNERARTGATVIVVGHRPAVLAVADHIIRVRSDAADLAEVGA